MDCRRLYNPLERRLKTILTPFELYICHLAEQGKTMEAIGKSLRSFTAANSPTSQKCP